MAYEFNVKQFDLIYAGLVGMEAQAKHHADWHYLEQIQTLMQSLMAQLPESED